MSSELALCQGSLTSPALSETDAGRYAWLEQNDGTWHFLTNLFADAKESTRRWPCRQSALNELVREGWAVVGPYPGKPLRAEQSCDGAAGYGLIWTGNSDRVPNA